MGNVVTKSTAITCVHQGTVTLKSTDMLTIQSVQALLAVTDGTSLTCPAKDNPNAGIKQCTKVLSVSKASRKLTVEGQPLLIAPFLVATDGLMPGPPPTLTSPSSKLNTQ